MPTLTVRKNSTLSEIADAVNAAHGKVVSSTRTTLEHARTAGEHLRKAKALVQHGEWLDWIEENLDLSSRTAQAYMQIAESWSKIKPQTTAELTLQSALKLITEKKPKEHESEPRFNDHIEMESDQYTTDGDTFISENSDGLTANFESVRPKAPPPKEKLSLLRALTQIVNSLSILSDRSEKIEITHAAQIRELIEDARAAFNKIEAKL